VQVSLPVLAEEIPTQANDDVSADGTVVTWRLKPGVTWSDGQPFTSQDLVFTFDMIMDPSNPIATRGDGSTRSRTAAGRSEKRRFRVRELRDQDSNLEPTG
jgi:ABC-type transport system substrate-binding protein